MHIFKELCVTYDLFKPLERVNKCRRHVIHSKNDLSDASLCQCLYLVTQNWLVTKEHQGLRYAESEGAQSCAIAADQDESLHFYIGSLFLNLLLYNSV